MTSRFALIENQECSQPPQLKSKTKRAATCRSAVLALITQFAKRRGAHATFCQGSAPPLLEDAHSARGPKQTLLVLDSVAPYDGSGSLFSSAAHCTRHFDRPGPSRERKKIHFRARSEMLMREMDTDPCFACGRWAICFLFL